MSLTSTMSILPSPVQPEPRLPQVPRQTPIGIIEEMKAACVTKDFQKFQMTFDSWASGGNRNIYDLDPVMLEAVKQDYTEIVSELLRWDFPIHQDYALEAIKHKSKNTLDIFLEHGWNINQPTSELKPPALGYAIDDEEMTIWFLDRGADPNQQCSIDLTPLSYAVERASLRSLKLLLDRGGDARKGQLLHHAIDRQADVVHVLAMLLEKGAPLNSKMYENHYPSWRLFYFMGLGTALHKAAESGNLDAVHYLISQGADTGIKDETGRTALDCAAVAHHLEIVEFLRSVMEK